MQCAFLPAQQPENAERRSTAIIYNVCVAKHKAFRAVLYIWLNACGQHNFTATSDDMINALRDIPNHMQLII
jgi:hypothetical protein